MGQRRAEPGIAERIAARRARLGAQPRAIVHWPDRAEAGSAARGRALLSGQYWTRPPGFAAPPQAVAIPNGDLWALDLPGPGASGVLHAHLWLHDLADLGSRAAARQAMAWIAAWDARFGSGRGPGWTAPRAARRLLAWTGHLDFLAGADGVAPPPDIVAAMDQHLRYLVRRAGRATGAFERAEIAAAIVLAGLALDDRSADALHAAPALSRALQEAAAHPGPATGRSPGRLLALAGLALRVRRSLVETGHTPPQGLADALARFAPTLRALCHADGGLSRFRGGGAGVPGALDRVLAEAPVAARPADRPVMGYGRLAAGGHTVIVDAGLPGPADSRLAFELSESGQPIVVAAGAVLALPGAACPVIEQDRSQITARLDTARGFVASRQLWLEPDGWLLGGRDHVATGRDDAPDALFIRFPLHPDLIVEEISPTMLVLFLPRGGFWVFAHAGDVVRTLEPFAWFDPTDAAHPGARPALAIRLCAPQGARVLDVAWMFERAVKGAGLPGDLQTEAVLAGSMAEHRGSEG